MISNLGENNFLKKYGLGWIYSHLLKYLNATVQQQTHHLLVPQVYHPEHLAPLHPNLFKFQNRQMHVINKLKLNRTPQTTHVIPMTWVVWGWSTRITESTSIRLLWINVTSKVQEIAQLKHSLPQVRWRELHEHAINISLALAWH